MAQSHLKAVGRAADRMEKKRLELRDACWRAHLSGESYRDIAPYAGLSASRVGEMVREARRLYGETLGLPPGPLQLPPGQ